MVEVAHMRHEMVMVGIKLWFLLPERPCECLAEFTSRDLGLFDLVSRHSFSGDLGRVDCSWTDKRLRGVVVEKVLKRRKLLGGWNVCRALNRRFGHAHFEANLLQCGRWTW